MKSAGDQTSEVDNDQLTAITDPLTTTKEVAKELNVAQSMVIWCLKQTGKVKRLDKWMPHKPTGNQKSRHSEVLSSLILHNNEPFLNQIVTYDQKMHCI
ncbi:PREDICTED: histone-lysine N-methyltransferase SETMAR-like [Bison bison bison]|uniref:Histone-lysine N-methyltransferase SETMAR-like n=1 Tax=Bison bison bison TaxID=43346 RepID=A0A6P3IK47_BISBB|nr:PREDICTED: histone-lysine N-methyltransferase SETMAR-like [Bison bison bison]